MNRAFDRALGLLLGLVQRTRFSPIAGRRLTLPAQSALAAASTFSAWPSTFTFSQTSATLPSGPIR